MNHPLPTFNDSVPIDPLLVATNYFSLDCLEITFNLLREQQPCLALVVQNIIAEARHQQTHNHQDKQVALHLELEQVSKIVSALSTIAEQAAQDKNQRKSTLVNIHQTLFDWLLYAQSFLVSQNSPNNNRPGPQA